MTGAEESGALELRISKYEDDLWIAISILHLTRATLQECVGAAEARVHGGADATAAVWLNTMAGLALTVLLYLRGEPDVIKLVHPGAKPIKESIRRRDPERWKDLDDTGHLCRRQGIHAGDCAVGARGGMEIHRTVTSGARRN
ncbi:MAG: hypothetical protein ACLQU2_06845 [Candidatus Binataceae bacterium]